MTTEHLTGILAERVMRWGVAPDRFLMSGRSWTPRWRFQPTKKLEDAFRLLDAADPDEYCIESRRARSLYVRVLLGGSAGESVDASKPRAITHAIARAIGVEPDSGEAEGAGEELR